MITGVMLSWKRPTNVQRIVEWWHKDPLITEAIVWNNNPAVSLALNPWATLINASTDLGLYTRFLAALLAKNSCILIHDDDLYLPPASVAQLYSHWKRAPGSLHGRFGRKPTRDNKYALPIEKGGRAPVVLTRALMTNKRHLPVFFAAAPSFAGIMRDSKPYGNGEDIVYSYVVRKAMRGVLHYVHSVDVQKLPSPHAIHKVQKGSHVHHRTRVMRACEDWLRR